MAEPSMIETVDSSYHSSTSTTFMDENNVTDPAVMPPIESLKINKSVAQLTAIYPLACP